MIIESLLAHTQLSPLAFVAVALIVTGAYTVFGLTGFGASILAMPLLTQIVPLRTAVPAILLFDLIAGTLLGLRSRRLVHGGELRRIVPGVLVGMAAGLALLLWVPERPLLLVLGVFVLGHSAWSLLSRRGFREISPRLALPFGLGGGLFTAMFGTGGPVYTIFLAGRLADPAQLRATVSTLIVFTAFARLVMFAGAGLYADPAPLVLAGAMMPFAILGYVAGGWLHSRIAPQRVLRLVWGILIFAGAGLIYRSLLG